MPNSFEATKVSCPKCHAAKGAKCVRDMTTEPNVNEGRNHIERIRRYRRTRVRVALSLVSVKLEFAK